MSGLSGHLDQFWPDIKDSAWIGGTAEGWERMPYWLDGVIPLAWLLGDETLKQRINGYVDYIVEHQHADGWLGPRVEDREQAADLWSQALALKGVVRTGWRTSPSGSAPRDSIGSHSSVTGPCERRMRKAGGASTPTW